MSSTAGRASSLSSQGFYICNRYLVEKDPAKRQVTIMAGRGCVPELRGILGSE